jgi:X-X-X-Leu-X-X-Gly heptad repeat protein
MKKIYKKAVVGILSTAMVMSIETTALAAATSTIKEENIYAILQNNGEVASIYTVNSFELQEPGQIFDYGNYDTVRNMTTTEELSYNNGVVTVNAPKGRFYYQGNPLSKELPWDIQIEYRLDSKKIEPTDLLGKSGKVAIEIHVGKNSQVKEEFFENYSLQISLSLEDDKFSQITAEGATLANAGNNKSITFTHLPGSEKSYIINADVTNFELAPIQFNGVMLSMDIELEGVDTMTEDFTKLTDGIKVLKDGTTDLKDGSNEFNNGISEFASSSSRVKSSSKEIKTGIVTTASGLSELLKSTEQLKMLANLLLASEDQQTQTLANGYLAQIAALEQLSVGLSALEGSYSQFDSGVSQVVDGISSLASGYDELNNGITKLSEGVDEMYSGTSNLDTQIEEKMDEMISSFTGEDFKPVSYLSERNQVESVQFIVRTNALEHVEEVKQVEEESKPLTFWQKLLKLFGLLKEE